LGQHEPGASEVAIFAQVIHQSRDGGVLCGLGMVVPEKSLQPQLVVSPVPDDVIVPLQHIAVPLPERFRIPSVFVVANQAVRVSSSHVNHRWSSLKIVASGRQASPAAEPAAAAAPAAADCAWRWAWYELRTSGPDSTWANPRASPSCFSSSNSSG